MVNLRDLPPLLVDDGTGTFVRNPSLSDADFATITSQIQTNNVSLLWQAATDYQESYISGMAGGLVTLGVLQQKPKSLAVMGWINSVWGLYYARKPQITYEWNADLMDFSSCGPMPCSVPDLMTEVNP